MLKLLSGAAALALVASTAYADPGGGKGGGEGKGGGKDRAAHVEKARGGGKEARGHSGKAEARGNSGKALAREDRRGRNDEIREARGKDFAKEVKANKGGKDELREARGKGRKDDVRIDRDDRFDRDVRVARGDRDRFDWDDVVSDRSRGLIAGCPPGLAKKNTGCLPPGQFKKAAALAFVDRPDWWDFDDDEWFDGMNWEDGRYRYVDGYLVRYDDDGIDGWLPLLGGALAPGNLWPSYYQPVTLPDYYQDYYGLGPAGGYGLYDDALFRLDPETQAITAIAALLTGDEFAIGQPLPLGYDVYNVPYGFRDQYVDGPDAAYRYSDGYVYQVDPTTQLITAAIQLLT